MMCSVICNLGILLLKRKIELVVLIILFCTVTSLTQISSFSTEIADNAKFLIEYQDVVINDLPGELQNWTLAKNQGICTGNGIESNPYIIENIDFNGTDFCLSILNSVKYFIIRYCTISGTNGLLLSNVTNGQIIESNIILNDGEGMNIDSCSTILISGNIITDNDVGVLISSCTFVSLSNNKIGNNNKEGIKLVKDNNNIIISENEITSNIQEGIMRDKDSFNNTCWGNEISNNTLSGIHVKGPAAINNLFYANFFRNNNPIARDDNDHSNWNTSIIGNFWNDYTGEDANGDGIGDTPYTIPGTAGSIDYLPIWDEIAPIIIINSPNPDDVFSLVAPSFDVSVIEPNLDEMWYTLDSGLHNYTFEENSTINQLAWDAAPFGSITLTFYARDKIGNVGSADVIVEKEVQALTITINSPNDGEIFGSDAPGFNITVNVANLDKVWYNLNGGNPYLIESFSGTINQTAWSALADGSIILTFYANDSIGNFVSEEVNIIKSIAADKEPRIAMIVGLSLTFGGAAVCAGVLGTLMYLGKIEKPKRVGEYLGKIKKPEWLGKIKKPEWFGKIKKPKWLGKKT